MAQKVQFFSTEQLAKQLNVGTTTIRKYSQHLEKQGYKFARTERRARQFTEKDKDILMQMIAKRNSANITVEQAASVILQENGMLHPSNDSPNENHQPSLEQIHKLLTRQQKLLTQISERLDYFEEYVHRRLNERDKELLKEFNDRLEKQKEISAAIEQESNEKQGIIHKLFKPKS